MATVPPEMVREVFRRDRFECVYCGHDGRTFEGWTHLTVDHFLPVSAGGKTELSNLKTACHVCNVMKQHHVYSTVEDAKRDLLQWWGQMRRDWKQNYKPLIV
jgi:5-methylcytosine-specific restriction endonuclease McrA